MINPQKELELLVEGPVLREIQKLPSGEIRIFDNTTEKFCYWSKNKLRTENADILTELNPKGNSNSPLLKPSHHTVRNEKSPLEICVSIKNYSAAYRELAGNWQLIDFDKQNPKDNLRYYLLNDTSLWISDKSNNGIEVFNLNGKPIFPEKMFRNFIISDIIDVADGSIWISTLGQGILVIPNRSFVTYNFPELRADFFRDITFIDNELFALFPDRLFRMDNGKFVQVPLFNTKRLERLHYLENEKLLLLDSDLINISTRKKWSLVADKRKHQFNNRADLGNGRYAFSTSSGIFFLDISDLDKLPVRDAYYSRDQSKPFFQLEIGRTWSMAFDSASKLLWVETTNGLATIDSNLNDELVLQDGKNFSAKALLSFNNQIWVGTKNGVYVYQQDSLYRHITSKEGLLSEDVTLLQYHRDFIYVGTSLGLQRLSLSDSAFHSITPSDGLYSTHFQKLEFLEDDIYIKYPTNLQRVNFNTISSSPTTNFYISEVAANGAPLDLTQSKNLSLDYTQNQLRVVFKAKGYNHRGNITYNYRLIGLNDEWVSAEYSNNSVDYNALEPGTYTFEVQAIREKLYPSEIQRFTLTIHPPWWKTWWFYLAAFLIIAGSLYLYIRRLFTRQRRELQLQNELGNSKLTAIKSQMNPHFIFNSLNSIQDLVLQQDQDKAYTYIGKFAKLVRQVLSFSDQDFIEVEDEITMLKLYLELEQLRFKNDFSYSIDHQNVQDLSVPPMLIQPFAENALKHGLLHKKGDKKLSIEMHIQGEILKCIITDNGIGRSRSEEIKQRQNRTHKSFSVQGTKDRFDILQKQFGGDLGLEFLDLMSKNGEAKGTQVTLSIPCKRKF